MSVWTNIEGNVKILKSDKVSIKEVISDTLSDEHCTNVDTSDCGEFYNHHITSNVCIDGYDFIKCYKKFLDNLKPINGGLDLTCSIRFL
jgi:hypothetical protein